MKVFPNEKSEKSVEKYSRAASLAGNYPDQTEPIVRRKQKPRSGNK